MGKTKAQRLWVYFERLALELIQQSFAITPTKVFRTQESKDGGFDAVLVHDLGKLQATAISHEVLMEAKLRSGPEAVGLRAFAATMIIAFNGRTQCLVVVTNRAFSPQALAAARDFQWKSRLQVILVHQRTLSAWIRPRFTELCKRFPEELLSDILLPDAKAEEFVEEEIPEGDLVGLERRARVASGRLPDGSLASCEVKFILARDMNVSPVNVVGVARRQLVAALLAAISGETGCAMIVGAQGSGKSHLVSAALADLPADRRLIGLIDLAQIVTSRQLFVTIFAHLSGVDISEAARHFTYSDSKQVFSTMSGIGIPEDMTTAVVSVLGSSDGPSASSDIDQIHLSSYLSHVANRAGSGSRLIVFHNIASGTPAVMEFLHVLIPVLVSGHVTVLLEFAVGGDAPALSRSRLDAYRTLFAQAATLGLFEVSPLSLDDSIALLLEYMPGLGTDRARFISERVGTRPLFLHHAALWLKRRHVVQERAHGAHVVEDPELFFEGLRPESCLSILDRHIDLWRRDLELPYADAIAAASLLDGELPYAAIRALLEGRHTPEAMLDSLVSTGLFVSSPRLSAVRVSHSLLLERMISMEEGQIVGYGARRFNRSRVARILLSVVDDLAPHAITRDLYRSALLEACEEWTDAWECAKRVGEALYKEVQMSAAAGAFLRCLRIAERVVAEGDERGPLWKILALVAFLQAENHRYRLGTAENSQRLDTLSLCLRTSKVSIDSRDEITIRALYLRWRATFTQERFDESLPIAKELFESVCAHREMDFEVAGNAVAALGITLKAVELTEESLRVFDKGIELFPGSVTCRAQRWSNLAALALRRRPDQALVYYRKILDEVGDGTSMLDRIHTEVDVAMALFLDEKLEYAIDQAAKAILLADANALPAQSSRARNILACVHWCKGQIDDSLLLLERAILDAERSYMERFLWRFRVNLASLAAEAGQVNSALASARWAEDRLLAARASRLKDIAQVASHVTSRWYVALLAIGLAYQRCGSTGDAERLKARVNELPEFERHLRDLSSGGFPPEIFNETTHLHASRIMITG
jgi:tetratricopeptide (TPR) repeat protein